MSGGDKMGLDFFLKKSGMNRRDLVRNLKKWEIQDIFGESGLLGIGELNSLTK